MKYALENDRAYALYCQQRNDDISKFPLDRISAIDSMTRTVVDAQVRIH